MKKLIVAIALILLFTGMATAMRWNIGASQVSRIDIGAAQESETASNVNDWWWRRRQGQHHEPLNLIPLRQLTDLPATLTAGKHSERTAA